MAGETEMTDKVERRFEFGQNWSRFAADMPPARIDAARASLEEKLGTDSLAGLSFLDIGSGSGLFSLSAVLMGAMKIHSLDYDPDSVATTRALKERFAPDAPWTIEQASVLDPEQMRSLGQWDVVYSWGVLHHTGAMWTALEHVCGRVRPGGRLFISIYNDQGWPSRAWGRVKRIYNGLPRPLRVPFALLAMLPMETRSFLRQALKLRPGSYLRQWTARGDYERGMSRWHDLLDWVGGYPFEVATPEEVFGFCRRHGFELRSLTTVGGSHGCNEFVFELSVDREN